MTDEIIFEKEGTTATVILNRPKALNALSLGMIKALSSFLHDAEADDHIQTIFIEGAGGRAFCAGGDIRAVYRRRGDLDFLTDYFRHEYCLNRQLFHFPKPLIPLMDGIVMGGGFGVAGPCRYRIATENTVFAMPETAIGFFPDVGSVYFLNKAPGLAGRYLALTGNPVNSSDMLYCRQADYYVPSSQLGRLAAEIKEDGDIEKTLQRFSVKAEETGDIEKHQTLIDKHFSHDRVEAILQSLEHSDNSWCLKTAKTIKSRAPVSLKLSLAHIIKAQDRDFDQTMEHDFAIVQHFLRGHDFYEGIRAAVIDKDRQPQWQPAQLSDISEQYIEIFFTAPEDSAKASVLMKSR
jgi:enoyl-CoA hydratase